MTPPASSARLSSGTPGTTDLPTRLPVFVIADSRASSTPGADLPASWRTALRSAVCASPSPITLAMPTQAMQAAPGAFEFIQPGDLPSMVKATGFLPTFPDIALVFADANHLDRIPRKALRLAVMAGCRKALVVLHAPTGMPATRLNQSVADLGALLKKTGIEQMTWLPADAEIPAPTRVELSPANDPVASRPDLPPDVSDQFEAGIVWVGPAPMTPGRQYRLQMAGQETLVAFTDIKYREDLETSQRHACKALEAGQAAMVNMATSLPIRTRRTDQSGAGIFFVRDRFTDEMLAFGTLEFALRRASNIQWQAMSINKTERAGMKSQTPKCIWFTGLSGSGKSTIANLLEQSLHGLGRHTYVLDGDNVRHGLNRDLGFTEADRVENIRRVAEVARLMVDAGLIVLVSFISPFRAERAMARALFDEGEFIEVFVDTPVTECERRDVKGLYAKARTGTLKNFTGIDSPYEPPLQPEIRLDTIAMPPERCVQSILDEIR